MGWYAMAFVDALDFIPKHESGRDSMLVIFNKIASQIKHTRRILALTRASSSRMEKGLVM